jgi:hypothetical protein
VSERTKSDVFLLIIVIAIVGLVIAAFIVVANRPAPQYENAGTAESTVHDYLLAMELGDYERAYSYLAPDLGYPATYEEFYDSIQDFPWQFAPPDNASLIVESSAPAGERREEVRVRQIAGSNSLFGGRGYSYEFIMTVEETAEGPRIVFGESFWSPCWGDENSCDENKVTIP